MFLIANERSRPSCGRGKTGRGLQAHDPRGPGLDRQVDALVGFSRHDIGLNELAVEGDGRSWLVAIGAQPGISRSSFSTLNVLEAGAVKSARWAIQPSLSTPFSWKRSPAAIGELLEGREVGKVLDRDLMDEGGRRRACHRLAAYDFRVGEMQRDRGDGRGFLDQAGQGELARSSGSRSPWADR